MPQKRLRGAETFIRLVQNNGVQENTWISLSNIEITYEMEVMEEEFLGDPASRYDGIYKGISFSLEVQISDTAEQELTDAIVAKNQRRGGAAAAQRFDITITEALPSGQSNLITLVDVEFGAVNKSFGARAEYVKVKFEGNCSQASSQLV